MCSQPPRSAIVRATLTMRSWAGGEVEAVDRGDQHATRRRFELADAAHVRVVISALQRTVARRKRSCWIPRALSTRLRMCADHSPGWTDAISSS
jgi:hypothetical protein